jgi:VWFA-related protein
MSGDRRMQCADRFTFLSIRIVRVLLCVNLAAAGSAIPQADAQALLQPDVAMSSPGLHEDLFDPDAKDDSQYSDGTKAIHEGRWADAEAIFSRLALQRGAHSEGAYYWKAYAENKEGNSIGALKTCADLQRAFAHSQWNEECAALATEISGAKAPTGSDVGQQDDTARLHAIDALMARDQTQALAEIQSILSGEQSESLKERALFLLVANNSPAGRQMLEETANSSSNAALQSRARQILSALQRQGAVNVLKLHRIGINVAVTDSSGQPVSGLRAQDFTLLDNKQARPIQVFAANPGRSASGSAPRPEYDPLTQVIILIDTVNASLSDVAYERQQVADYLHQNHGHLDQPVKILLFNGSGVQTIGGPTHDGDGLAIAVAKADSSLHPFRRSQGFYGVEDRIQFSINALNSIAAEEVKQPGRKALLWVTPSWPVLARSDFDSSQRRQDALFAEIVAISNNLRLAQIMLYSVDPNFSDENNVAEWSRYKDFRKPALTANDAEVGNLTLQVIAEQSGGQVFSFSNDTLSVELAKCVGEANAPYYGIHFDVPVAKRKNEFHSLTVTVNRPGLTVRTNHGYYNQP